MKRVFVLVALAIEILMSTMYVKASSWEYKREHCIDCCIELQPGDGVRCESCEFSKCDKVYVEEAEVKYPLIFYVLETLVAVEGFGFAIYEGFELFKRLRR